MSFENAAVHAARPVAGGRGKDPGLREMVPFAVGNFPKLPRVCLISVSRRRNALGMVGLGIGESGLSQGVGALRGFGWGAYSPARRPTRAIGFGDPLTVCESFLLACRGFRTRIAALWQLCAGDLRVCRNSVPVRQPAYSCHPFVWRR